MNNIITTFSTSIYSSEIFNYDIIQNELEESYNKVNFSLNPQWGHTHYLSDPTFKEHSSSILIIPSDKTRYH